MKHFSFEPLKNWFGYTRRERRSSFILLCMIAVVATARFIIPGQNMKVEVSYLGFNEVAKDSLPRDQEFIPKSGNIINGNRKQSVLLEINTCDSSSLEALPGIGPVLASRIIKFRNLLNGYVSVEQLKEVYGLSEETYNVISDKLTCDPSHIRKINMNSADYKQLIRLPYFDRFEVNAILKYRELQGRVEDVRELVENKIISPEKAEKVKSYLKFDD
jgi:DNA uptake protein ComE-like DNA-binding protein